MLSRVADSIYWMHHYIERAENVARFIDVNLHLMLDLAVGTTEQWQPLVDATGDRQVFAERYGEATRDNVVAFLTFDTENPNSIVSCLRLARDNARSVREVISSEMWEQVNRFYLMVRQAAVQQRLMDAPHDFFPKSKTPAVSLSGWPMSPCRTAKVWGQRSRLPANMGWLQWPICPAWPVRRPSRSAQRPLRCRAVRIFWRRLSA